MSKIFLEKNKYQNRKDSSIEKSKLVSSNKKNSNKGFSKHLPVANKEWSNSIYLYNKNRLKLLPFFDKIVLKLIKSYFNLFKNLYKKNTNKVLLSKNGQLWDKQQLVKSTLKKLKKKIKILKKLKKLKKLNLLMEMRKKTFFFNSETMVNSKQNKLSKRNFKLKLFKVRQRLIKAKRRSIKKIVVSKAELKHTNSKVIITVYIYNSEERSLLKKLNSNRINPLLKNTYNNFNKKIKIIKTTSWKVLLKKTLFFSIISNKIKWLKNNQKFKLYLIKVCNKFFNDFIKKSLKKQKLVLYYKHLLYFNRRKFENTYLLPLNLLINKIYSKKVEFNLVNLKYLHLNSDIMSQSISRKLTKKQALVLKVLRSFLNSTKLQTNIGEKHHLLNLYNKVTIDKHRQSAIANPILLLKEKKDQTIKNNKLMEKTKVKNFYLNTLLTSKVSQETDKNLMDQISQGVFLKKDNNYSNYLKTTTIDSIKYKWVNGIRIEVAGGLSRRLNNRRSDFKFKYNGNLKNIYSSFKGLSSVMLRGHIKPNVGVTKLTSKNRKGSFGLKGWVSSI